MSMSICIFGGSFDPVHIGHLALADAVQNEYGCGKILFIPAYQNPLKKISGGASVDDRIEMLRSAVSGNDNFIVDTYEAHRQKPSYTIDTVSYVLEKYCSSEPEQCGRPGLIIGDDLALSFPQWRQSSDIAAKTQIIIGRRTATGFSFPELPYPHRMLENAVLPVSSSDIRSRISHGRSWRYLVSDSVYRYILDRNLYGY